MENFDSMKKGKFKQKEKENMHKIFISLLYLV